MSALPVCPHCDTVYRYAEVRKSLFKKNIKCYHCEKHFAVSKSKLMLLLIIIIAAALTVDFFELYFVSSLSAAALIITNIVIVTIGFLLIPYFLKYKKLKENKR